MQIHDLKPVHENKPVMLVGRGGKRGKTSGRGIKGKTPKIKILGARSSKDDAKNTEVKKYLVSGCLVSAGAKAAIEKAGGSVTL